MTSKPKWFVWATSWHSEYTVLFKLQDGHADVWSLDKDNNLYKNENAPRWDDLLTKDIPDFLQIDEEEALKIIIGGWNYAKPKYSNYRKTHGMSGVS